MDGISRGTTLGGRYTLQQALSDRDGVQQWVADDGTLGREVTVTVFDADHRFVSAALDSARRVAGVEDRRLAQVLDVGTEAEFGAAYVVTEATHHAQSVAALLRAGTLPAEEVRRLVGESSVALETSRQRGLHHQNLGPHEILRGPDGAVQVTGVALSAALAGQDEDDGDMASREDVTSLVGVTYAGLTGLWPLDNEIPGIESVERRADGQVPAPSELVNRVPGDLDTLCRTVLNADEGPRTPGELARQLSPWSAERVHGAGGRQASSAEPEAGPSHRERRLATGTTMTGAALAGPDAGRTEDEATDPGSLGESDATVVGRRPEFDHDETSAYAASRPRDNENPYLEEDLDPPLPLLTHGTQEPDRNSSRLALAIVAGVTVLALLLGFLGLRGMFGGGSEENTANPSSAQPGASSKQSKPRSTAPPAQPVDVESVDTFASGGGGEEHGWEAMNVIDDDQETTWETRFYGNPQFSEGRGPGLVLNLGKETAVREVKVLVDGAPIAAQVSTSNDPSSENATEIGTIDGDGEQVAKASAAQKGRYVIVQITRLGEQDNGQNRARIAQVQVLS